ncbi:hypothetical protein B0A48_14533 [Cryoendolithus antarcticus]|uniref:Uncharacterized protein n=1 Tax=Cryoendolithus antarcticus TaxID=1507870 RepID=A0A1V8SL12_9PEZI|nr:hypothetical protein B0A48_14533 [Cryoendolithus antarcticus]
MDDPKDLATNATFRQAKRRKIVSRKFTSATGETLVVSRDDEAAQSHHVNGNDRDQDQHSDSNGGDQRSALPNRVRRQRKHGVMFSNTPPPANMETALAIDPQQTIEVDESHNARFVKPTGKATVTDDKHMSAFIDSKLAEMKANAKSSQQPPSSTDSLPSGTHLAATSTVANQATQSKPSAMTPKTDQAPKSRQRRRREPRPPSPSQVARDSLIDQILSESQSANPHYDPLSANPTPPPGLTDSTLDNDTLAAMQFKAEFLAAAEERNLMRRPPANPSQALGPKLGGSRAARDRMKAAEEAAAEAAKGKK